MKRKIKYIGFYDISNQGLNKRVGNLAAINKMNYVASAIINAGYEVEVISPSWIIEDDGKIFEKQQKVKVHDGLSVLLCPSWITKFKITKVIKVLFSLLWLFLYLILNVKRNEKVLAYHVPWISIPIRIAKFLKGFKLILEVEEIYSEVWDNHKKTSNLECRLIEIADYYIFVSDLLQKRFESEGKESIVLYGSYMPVNHYEKKNSKNDIDMVYAGSIDSIKGGAYKAIELMEQLPSNYKLHILGYGTPTEIKKAEILIENINLKKDTIVCKYHGVLHGEEYSNFIYNCDIALNTQNQGEYMGTAFPSKIISYLSHNLRVVSTPIESIKVSSISNYINFSKDDEIDSLVETVLSIDSNSTSNSADIIGKLDKEFVVKIKLLLEG